VADTALLLPAALMLVGAFLASGAWLLRRRGARYLLVIAGAGVFAVGVAALARALS
jgi:hypothetical protein